MVSFVFNGFFSLYIEDKFIKYIVKINWFFVFSLSLYVNLYCILNVICLKYNK